MVIKVDIIHFADTQAPDSPEWIRVDLGSVQSVTRVLLNWENTGKSFQIQTSTDGTTWSTAYATTNGDGGIDDISFSARSARFVENGMVHSGRMIGATPSSTSRCLQDQPPTSR